MAKIKPEASGLRDPKGGAGSGAIIVLDPRCQLIRMQLIWTEKQLRALLDFLHEMQMEDWGPWMEELDTLGAKLRQKTAELRDCLARNRG
jgi:hypothetical protein